MGSITSHAFMPTAIAYIAWDIDGKVEDCLGFEITGLSRWRRKSSAPPRQTNRVKCAAWVAFRASATRIGFPGHRRLAGQTELARSRCASATG
jgi:hypothetical protein